MSVGVSIFFTDKYTRFSSNMYTLRFTTREKKKPYPKPRCRYLTVKCNTKQKREHKKNTRDWIWEIHKTPYTVHQMTFVFVHTSELFKVPLFQKGRNKRNRNKKKEQHGSIQSEIKILSVRFCFICFTFFGFFFFFCWVDCFFCNRALRWVEIR